MRHLLLPVKWAWQAALLAMAGAQRGAHGAVYVCILSLIRHPRDIARLFILP